MGLSICSLSKDQQMTYNRADGARLNTILGKKVFKSELIETDEVKKITGLSIRELVMCWLFDPRNDFQKFLSEWRETGKMMDYREIQRY